MIPVVSIAAACLFPVLAIVRRGKWKRPYLLSICSFACGMTALLLELDTVRARLRSGDIGGLEDTMGAVWAISIAVIVVCVVLNLLALGLTYEKD